MIIGKCTIAFCAVLLLTEVTLAVNALKLPKSCDLKANEELDSSVAKLLVFGEHGRLYPENRQQLKEFCDESRAILLAVEQFKNKCFTGTIKHFSSLFVYSNRSTMKQFCSKSNRRIEQFWSAAKCVNANMPKLNRCMKQMIDNFIGIKHAENGKKMSFVCCEYVKLVQCFTEKIIDSCKAEMDTLLSYLQSLMGNFESSCGEYNSDTDKCALLGSPPKKLAKEAAFKSILYPLLDIVESLPQ